jgi:phenylacetic acid degradation operon negative regulatory protein
VQPKTEELLYFLLWSAEQLTRPSFRNLNESFESWAYHNGLLRQIAALERKRFLEGRDHQAGARVYRLTPKGHLHALGGRNPQVEWARSWDGRWRLVLFDLPVAHNTARARLRRYLRDRRFGCLQKSVWITPRPLHEEVEVLRGTKIDVKSLIFLEARSYAGESNAEIVAGAWDFRRINSLYHKHLEILAAKPKTRKGLKADAVALRRWAAAERVAWRNAVMQDPFLPERLLPRGYIGRRAWSRRVAILGKAKRDLQRFNEAAR